MLEPIVPADVQPCIDLSLDHWPFDVWPHHPQPLPDECLSGYVLRLGELNGCSSARQLLLHLFHGHHNGNGRHNRHDGKVLLWEYAPADWGSLPSLVQLPVSSLLSLTVTPLVQKFRSSAVTLRAGAGAGYHVHGLIHPHLRVCGLCLQEQPYVRRIWRFASVLCCLKHRVLLESRCPTCSHPLLSFGSKQRHLHCAACGADLRRVVNLPAPDSHLQLQQAIQAGLHFLLDPAVSLVSQTRQARRDAPETSQACDLLHQIALKFRYLQNQSGLSTRQWSATSGFRLHWVYRMHLGMRVPITHYLNYLSALGYSWPQFAALNVPESFGDVPHLDLHICPTVGCVNSFKPSPQNVHLTEDYPERGVARLTCNACKRRFSRAYSGELRTSQRVSVESSTKKTIRYSETAVAQARHMGLRGDSNGFIEQSLHWSTGSATQVWISLGILDQIRQAQEERQHNNQLGRLALAQAEVDAVLPVVIKPDQLITAKSICGALKRSPSHMGNRRGLRPYVRSIVQTHNQAILQRRRDDEAAMLHHILDTLDQHPELTSMKRIADSLRRSSRYLRSAYPEINRKLLDAFCRRSAILVADRTRLHLQQIESAAKHLLDRNVRLQHHSILKEAGLNLTVKRSPEIYAALNAWTCGSSTYA